MFSILYNVKTIFGSLGISDLGQRSQGVAPRKLPSEPHPARGFPALTEHNRPRPEGRSTFPNPRCQLSGRVILREVITQSRVKCSINKFN